MARQWELNCNLTAVKRCVQLFSSRAVARPFVTLAGRLPPGCSGIVLTDLADCSSHEWLLPLLARAPPFSTLSGSSDIVLVGPESLDDTLAGN